MNPAPEYNQSLLVAHRWRGRDLAFFGGAFVLLLVPITLIQILGDALAPGPLGRAILIALTSIAFELGLIAFTAFLTKSIYGLSYREEMAISRHYDISSRTLITMGTSLALLVLLTSPILEHFLPQLSSDQPSPMEELLATPQTVALFAFFGVALAPALEELVFRGFLYRVLEDILGSSVAVWTTATLFAVAHGPQLWPNWAAIIVILAVGFVLSHLRRRTGSVIPGFIVHTVYNTVLFLLVAVAGIFGPQ